MSDEEVLYKLLQENEYSNVSEIKYSSDSEINGTVSSCRGQGVSAGEEENVSDSSSMHEIRAKSGAE
jgi:hypothetical protein